MAKPLDPELMQPPEIRIGNWPSGASFALFLSHDVDQIHDRELFRVLADLNHIRRVVTQGESGHMGRALGRIGRSLVAPKSAIQDFETILAMETQHGFRSTFFLLHDRYWARQGARYSFKCPEIRDIARMILRARGELGVHGGYYRFNNAALYRQSMDAVESNFGVRPCGIRNHLLRFSNPETWLAQAEAGFDYDATFGWPDQLGPRGGLALPFFPSFRQPPFLKSASPVPLGGASTTNHQPPSTLNLLELPLTVMDTTLFRYLGLAGEKALSAAWDGINKVIASSGMVSLLWHNNFFNEPEYWDWHMVYEQLLRRLSTLKPWCATGAEINRWWRARAGVSIEVDARSRSAVLRSSVEINDLLVTLSAGTPTLKVLAPGSQFVTSKVGNSWMITVARLTPGESLKLQW